MNPFTYTFIKQEQCEVLGSTEIRLAWNKGFKNAQLRRILAILESQQYAIRGAWKIIFKGKIDPLIPWTQLLASRSSMPRSPSQLLKSGFQMVILLLRFRGIILLRTPPVV